MISRNLADYCLLAKEKEFMRIIISPAKKMKIDMDTLSFKELPQFVEQTKIILQYLKEQNYETVKDIWKCNETIANLNYERINNMDLHKNLTPAILSYEGIQYKYMAPNVFVQKELDYLEKHLRILSGFYGMLKPFDGVVPYRLEMQARLGSKELDSLYAFWKEKMARQLFLESNCIINLASKEYSKCITSYLNKNIRFITCSFVEVINNKIVEKGIKVKMARGEMVRFMAEKQILNPEELKDFNRLNYTFSEDLSNESKFVYIAN